MPSVRQDFEVLELPVIVPCFSLILAKNFRMIAPCSSLKMQTSGRSSLRPSPQSLARLLGWGGGAESELFSGRFDGFELSSSTEQARGLICTGIDGPALLPPTSNAHRRHDGLSPSSWYRKMRSVAPIFILAAMGKLLALLCSHKNVRRRPKRLCCVASASNAMRNGK
jgi:hypothetical protein